MTKRGPGLVVSLVVIGLGIAIAIPSLIGVVRPFVRTVGAPSVVVPGSFSENLSKGHYAIFEVTPSVPLASDEVTVRSPEGLVVPTYNVATGDEFDRGGDHYRAIIRFDTPQGGRYQFTIRTTSPTKIIVARTFGQALHEARAWILPLILGAVATITGVVMLIVGLVRRRSQSPTAAPPPPGWYPDPQDATRWRYWDGYRWTEHTSGSSGGEDQQQGG